MQVINNGPSPWSHESTAYGLLAQRAQLEQAQLQASEADQIWEETLKRFWERCDKPDQHMTFGAP